MDIHTELPLHPDDLTAAWLSDALSAGGQNAKAEVVDVKVEKIATGRGFIGQVFRLIPEYQSPDPTLPTSMIAKLPSANPQTRQRNANRWWDRKEVYFYRTLAARTPVRTASCYFTALESEAGSGVLLLEDLGPACESYEYFDPPPMMRIQSCIDAVTRVHAHFWLGNILFGDDRGETVCA